MFEPILQMILKKNQHEFNEIAILSDIQFYLKPAQLTPFGPARAV